MLDIMYIQYLNFCSYMTTGEVWYLLNTGMDLLCKFLSI